jgi:hypothetical protein
MNHDNYIETIRNLNPEPEEDPEDEDLWKKKEK